MQAKKEDAKAEFNRLEETEMKPVIKLIQDGLEKYGKDKGYTVILDSSTRAVPFLQHELDVTDDLINELNKSSVTK